MTSTEMLTPEFLAATLHTKLARLAKAQTLSLEPPTTQDVVFRVMSDTHLPEETNEKRRKKSSSGTWVPKTNFPPFQHYVLHDNILIEVGRSHWQDDFEAGQFCVTHGKISNRLACMFLLLVEQYSRRGNWRGYCVSQSDEALTQRGWLGIDDINETDMILSYADGRLKWSKIKSIYRDDFDGKMFHLTTKGMDALVTPGHKFITEQDGLKDVDLLCEHDKLILTGQPVADGPAIYDDAFVELVGWFVTEGNIYAENQNKGDHVERLRACLAEETKLLAVAPGKVLSMPFILSLSQSQRQLLIDTMIDGDAWRTNQHRCYCQKDRKHVDAFVALCTIAGYRVSVKEVEVVSYGTPTTIHIVNFFSDVYNKAVVENIDFHGGKRDGQAHPNEPTIDYKGRVWCPETEYGSFMMRRNGTVFLVGNSYISDMRGLALVQLSQVGLQFDESRSDNPFAWYTQIIKNSFRRTLLLEKRNQDIRDDLLTMHGAMPSYTRQVDDEIEQRNDRTKLDDPHGESRAVELPKKRGRKPRPK